MASFIISFRIESNATSSQRWRSLTDKIKSEAQDQTVWEETTSFFLIRSEKDAERLASALFWGSSFDMTSDSLLVIDLARGNHATRGRIDYPATLSSFFHDRKSRPVNVLADMFDH